jgi:hypothetical protein
VGSRSKCNSFQSWASFLPFYFEPMWHVPNCCHNKMSLISTTIVNHFREYLEFFVLISRLTSFILFKCVVWTFFTFILLHVSSLHSFSLLLLKLHNVCKVLPKTLANLIMNKLRILGRIIILLLMLLTWKSLSQCFLDVFLDPNFYLKLKILIIFFLMYYLMSLIQYVPVFYGTF